MLVGVLGELDDPAGPAVQAVVPGLAPSGHDREKPKRNDDRCANPGAKARIGERDSKERGQRHETAYEVIGCRGARLGLQEVVIEQVEGDGADARDSDLRLASGRSDLGRPSRQSPLLQDPPRRRLFG